MTPDRIASHILLRPKSYGHSVFKAWKYDSQQFENSHFWNFVKQGGTLHWALMNQTPDLLLATTIRLLLDYLFFIIDYFRNYSQFCKYDIFPIITPHRCIHNGQGTALFMHIVFWVEKLWHSSLMSSELFFSLFHIKGILGLLWNHG